MSSGFSASARVCPTDQSTILLAIVARLQTDMPDVFGDKTCFVSDTPWPGVEVHDHLFATVCPSSADFDGDKPIGAADKGIVEHGKFQVTVWSRLSLDQLEHSVKAFTDAGRGLLTLKQRILRSLAGQQIYSDAPANTVPLLIEYLRPLQAMHPPIRQGEDDFSSFSLVFEGPFYWDLS